MDKDTVDAFRYSSLVNHHERQRKEKMHRRRLAIFWIFLAGLGWFGTGYQIGGFWLGLWMGLGSILVIAVCASHIESGGAQ